MSLCTAEIDTPLGPLTLGFRGETLCAAIFSDRWRVAVPSPPAPCSLTPGPSPASGRGELAVRHDVLPLSRLRERGMGGEGHRLGSEGASALKRVIDCFAAYWAGDLTAIDAIEVDPGGTPFQAKVWAELRRIPAGNTVSYGELAETLGLPRASRAVGAANAANPVWLVIPCHRVIGKDGTPRGYAGGISRKLQLLEHEGVRRPLLYRSPTPRAPSPSSGSWPAADPRSPSGARP